MITPQRKRFGKWLRHLRLSRGKTQEQVSDYCGYSSAQFVSNWERGCSFPPEDVLSHLAKSLDVPRRVLLDEVFATKQRELAAEHKAAQKKKVRKSA